VLTPVEGSAIIYVTIEIKDIKNMWAIKTFTTKSEAKRAAARIVEDGSIVYAKVQLSSLSEPGCYALWDVVVKEDVPMIPKTGKPRTPGNCMNSLAGFQWLNTAAVIARNFEY